MKAKRAGGVVQWAVKWSDGTYETELKKPTVKWSQLNQIVRVRITEIPAKASKRKAVKRAKAK